MHVTYQSVCGGVNARRALALTANTQTASQDMCLLSDVVCLYARATHALSLIHIFYMCTTLSATKK